MRRTRRTKKAYEGLFDDPTTLFPGCKVVLYPNGQPEIWIEPTGGSGYGFKITAGNGPAGVSVRVDPMGIGGPAMHLHGNLEGDWAVYPPKGTEAPAFRTADFVRYHNTDYARAHKAWYEGRGEYPGAPEGERAE